jgi:hypothetical protein
MQEQSTERRDGVLPVSSGVTSPRSTAGMTEGERRIVGLLSDILVAVEALRVQLEQLAEAPADAEDDE